MDEAGRQARQGKLDRARELAMRVLTKAPEHTDALFLTGSIDLVEGRHQEGERTLERLLAIDPRHADALTNYGLYKFRHCKDEQTALRCFEEIIRFQPDNVEALFNLGTVKLAQQRLEEAKAYFERIIETAPRHIGALNNLGATAIRMGRRDLAIFYYMKALEVSPTDTEIMANLLNASMAARVVPLCTELVDRLLRLPDPGPAIFPAYAFLKMRCLWGKAESLLPEVVKRIFEKRCTVSAFETVNLPLLATDELDRTVRFEIHKAAGAALVSPHATVPLDMAAIAGGDSRFRIGYLSPDFRSHVVSAFLRGLVNCYDRDRFEVFCYSNTREEDEITDQYRCAADHFVSVADMSDEELTTRIRSDRIRVLVDLAGYTHNGRTAVLSRRPAPVQAMYLGYPYTSGLNTVDYVLCDPYLDGPDNAAFFVEKPLRLPESFITFDSLHEQCIEPQVPVSRNGFVTFGSMNSTYKLNRTVLAVWSRVLHAAPNSRLIINHPNCDLVDTRNEILAEFLEHGVPAERVSLVWEKHPAGSHLRYYNDFDVMLDTFPLTGGTTTIDALWMGVPVVTLVGDIYPERLSYSVLSNAGLDVDDLIAFSPDEYVNKAVSLAHRPERIAALHEMIPGALKRSILCDPVRLTRQLEKVLLQAWNDKFPEYPFSLVPPQEHVEYVATSCGTELATDGDLEELSTYVLKEQQGCFDPEYPFVLDWFETDMHALDINAGIGVWALPLAKKSGGTVVATVGSAREARYLRRGKEHCGLRSLEIAVESDRTARLDREAERQNWPPFDFVRLNVQPFETAFLKDAEGLFRGSSPLVMLNIRRGRDSLDFGTADILSQWGYDAYHWLPGMGLLVRLRLQGELDSFSLNLFCCKEDRARSLAHAGLLVSHMEPLEQFPGIVEDTWAGYLESCPYAGPRLAEWISRMKTFSDWEAYWSALNLFAQARNKQHRPAQRLASLNASLGILLMLAEASATPPRLLSLARVLAEAGKREQAAGMLRDLLSLVENETLDLEAEPYLAPSARCEVQDPGSRLHEWLFAGLLEQFERLRAFSSYFSGPEVIPMLDRLVGTGFASEEMARRLALVRQRAGQS